MTASSQDGHEAVQDGQEAVNMRPSDSNAVSRPAAPKLPTIVDVARRSGVSKSVVSRVMRGATWVSPESTRAVLAAAADLGYRPNAAARSLVQRRTYTIGVMVSALDTFQLYSYLTDVITGISAVAEAHGYHVLITKGQRDPVAEAAELDRLLQLRVDGVLLVDTTLETDVISLASRSVPIVVVRRPIQATGVDTVNPDDARGARMAVEYLASLGHRRIAFVGGPGLRSTTRQRGYEMAMQDLDLAKEIQLAVLEDGAFEAGGYRGAHLLLNGRSRATAILAVNDLSAMGALHAIREAGLRVPSDVSVFGYGNTTLAALGYISLTTVDHPRKAMGEQAMTLLLERIARPDLRARRVLFEPSIVVRSTTSLPPSE